MSERSALRHTIHHDDVGDQVYSATPKTYSVPVFDIEGVDRIVLETSVPPIPTSLKNCEFAEHVFNAVDQESTDQVIVVGVGRIGVSNDLGQTWKRIELCGYESTRFYRCFTTQSGRHIVQALGWLGLNDTDSPEQRHGQLFVFSSDWNLIGLAKAGDARWHGSASIAEKNGTIMYADYFDNGAKYRSDFAASPSLQSRVRPCAIWRSMDDGLTWEKVFEQDPSMIRHFHTLIADPFEQNVWWASSGDLAPECRVWRSPDNGTSWIECTDPAPNIAAPQTFAAYKAAAHRYTDAVIQEDHIIWGADDLIGYENDYDPALPLSLRAGSRIYRSPKSTPLRLEEIAYVGQPVRSMTDVGKGWIITTEAKNKTSGYRSSVFFLNKTLDNLIKIYDVDNFRKRGTGFTFSMSSRKHRNGHFFSYKGYFDSFENSPQISAFKIKFEKD